MMSGKVQIAFNTIPAFLPHVKAGRLKALAITASARSPLLPDVPAMTEVGLVGVQGGSWHAVVAPAGTPREIVGKLNQTLVATISVRICATSFSTRARSRGRLAGGAEKVHAGGRGEMGTRDPIVRRACRLRIQWEKADGHRFRKLVSVAAVAVAAMIGAGMDKAAAQQKTTVVLGTATRAAASNLCAAYSAALNEADATLTVEQRGTKGSTENAPLLAEGKIDIGLATGEVTYEALTGIGRPPRT